MKLFLFLLATLLIISNTEDCPLPLYYEFIDNFTLGTDDLKTLCQNQYSTYPLDNFTSSNNIKFYNISFNTKYDGTGKQQAGQGKRIEVTGDGFSIVATMIVNVSKVLVGKDKFRVIVILDGITIDYSKQMKQGSLNPKISIQNINLHPQGFQIIYDPKPSANQEKKLKEAIVNRQGTTFETQFYNQLKKMAIYMNQNCEQEPFSKLFPQSIYQYKYYSNEISLDMSTRKIQFLDQKLLMNGLNATIMNNQDNKCFISDSFKRIQNAHTFISNQFMQNMASQALKSFSQFKNVKINRDAVRTQIFQFRMMDLQYVIPQALIKYPQFFQAQLEFICSAIALGDFHLGEQRQNKYQQIKWHCSGFFNQNQNTAVAIIDFQIMIRHILNIKISQTFLTINVDQLIIQYVNWNQIDGLIVQGQKLAKVLIEDTFNDLRIYTVGTYFKVINGTNQISYNDQGMWLFGGNQQ